MKLDQAWRAALAGIAGGFVGNGVLGALFTSEAVRGVLYNPAFQSDLFLSVTPQRDVAYSVIGLVLLSAIHGLLFVVFFESLPGKTWIGKGLAWGATIWAMFWLFQEWFVYHSLLGEPPALAAFELLILLGGSFVEGIVIAALLGRKLLRSEARG